MSNANFILNYMQVCASGKLAMAECGPMWQMAVIAVFLVLALAVLLVLRLRAGAAPRE
jgi:hypothetical protein